MVSGRFWLGSDGFGWVRVVSGFINNNSNKVYSNLVLAIFVLVVASKQ